MLRAGRCSRSAAPAAGSFALPARTYRSGHTHDEQAHLTWSGRRMCRPCCRRCCLCRCCWRRRWTVSLAAAVFLGSVEAVSGSAETSAHVQRLDSACPHDQQEHTRLLGVQQNLSSPYHPQSDGQTERVSRVFEKRMQYESPTQDDWEEHWRLPSCGEQCQARGRHCSILTLASIPSLLLHHSQLLLCPRVARSGLPKCRLAAVLRQIFGGPCRGKSSATNSSISPEGIRRY